MSNVLEYRPKEYDSAVFLDYFGNGYWIIEVFNKKQETVGVIDAIIPNQKHYIEYETISTSKTKTFNYD